MKRILKNTPKTRKYLESLPKMSIVACWAKYGVRTFPFSGKYEKSSTGVDIPLVWQYDDKNGTCDHYYLRSILLTTTGFIKCWTPYEDVARDIADTYNKHKEMGLLCQKLKNEIQF